MKTPRFDQEMRRGVGAGEVRSVPARRDSRFGLALRLTFAFGVEVREDARVSGVRELAHAFGFAYGLMSALGVEVY
jgi:hypothetical protein